MNVCACTRVRAYERRHMRRCTRARMNARGICASVRFSACAQGARSRVDSCACAHAPTSSCARAWSLLSNIYARIRSCACTRARAHVRAEAHSGAGTRGRPRARAGGCAWPHARACMRGGVRTGTRSRARARAHPCACVSASKRAFAPAFLCALRP